MPYASTDTHSSTEFPENFWHIFVSILFWSVPRAQTNIAEYSCFCSFFFSHATICAQHTQENGVKYIGQNIRSGKQALPQISNQCCKNCCLFRFSFFAFRVHHKWENIHQEPACCAKYPHGNQIFQQIVVSSTIQPVPLYIKVGFRNLCLCNCIQKCRSDTHKFLPERAI